MMSLQEAMEEVKRRYGGYDYDKDDFMPTRIGGLHLVAIATILNAVVKGELK